MNHLVLGGRKFTKMNRSVRCPIYRNKANNVMIVMNCGDKVRYNLSRFCSYLPHEDLTTYLFNSAMFDRDILIHLTKRVGEPVKMVVYRNVKHISDHTLKSVGRLTNCIIDSLDPKETELPNYATVINRNVVNIQPCEQ
ncbi:hypothetical protein LC76P1_00051 [Lysinibacillus phage LC76P1]|nr:hypothetical protein LC76P1_00051 [Lysinibacillus phage LC76P1]